MAIANSTDTTSADTEYVTNAAWLRLQGRADAIDEIADQFERPGAPVAETGAVAFWSPAPATRWPSESRGWRPAHRKIA